MSEWYRLESCSCYYIGLEHHRLHAVISPPPLGVEFRSNLAPSALFWGKYKKLIEWHGVHLSDIDIDILDQ